MNARKKLNKNNKDKGLKPEYVSEILLGHYKPTQGVSETSMDFDAFMDAVNEGIENESPSARLKKRSEDVEVDYEKRQRILKAFVQEEPGSKKKRKADEPKLIFETSKKKKTKPSGLGKLLSVFVIVALIGMGAFASYKYVTKYNYITIEEHGVDWSKLALSSEQKDRLKQIDTKWQEFEQEQEQYINERRELLTEELAKDKPSLVLLDKYQREVLDREIQLKREKAHVFLEKRFVLNEEQTLKLLELIRKAAES